MSFACPRCWDSPCTCGYIGYSVHYHPGPSQCEIDQERDQTKRQIGELRKEIERLKKLLKERGDER